MRIISLDLQDWRSSETTSNQRYAATPTQVQVRSAERGWSGAITSAGSDGCLARDMGKTGGNQKLGKQKSEMLKSASLTSAATRDGAGLRILGRVSRPDARKFPFWIRTTLETTEPAVKTELAPMVTRDQSTWRHNRCPSRHDDGFDDQIEGTPIYNCGCPCRKARWETWLPMVMRSKFNLPALLPEPIPRAHSIPLASIPISALMIKVSGGIGGRSTGMG